MAFVFRSEKKTQKDNNHHVGPGSYNFDVQRQNKIPKAYVPFGTMEPKSKQTKYNAQNTPGVGTYNLEPVQNGQKIVVSSETQDIKILQISRPHPVFKSTTDRFKIQQPNSKIPGPGAYQIAADNNTRTKIYSNNPSGKPQIIEHLININKYQSIPSIPSNVHAYGYNESEGNELQLNEPPTQIFKGEKEDTVGPGHYNPLVQTNKIRGVSWSQSKAKRIEQTNPRNTLGPGSYEVKAIEPLYSYKQSAEFASKSLRIMEQRKGAIANQFIEQKQKNLNNPVQIQESKIFSEKQAVSTNVQDSDDDSYEYIEDTTPGPGSYLQLYEPKKQKQTKAKKCFGSNAQRFNAKVQNANLGPGSYEVAHQPNFKKSSKKGEPIPPLNIQRFPGLLEQKKLQQPGPGFYQPRNTMEDKLIYKIQRGYRDSLEQHRLDLRKFRRTIKLGLATTRVTFPQLLKNKLGQKFIEQNGYVAATGLYNLNQYDIATKVIKEEQQDPELIIKKPGFGVGQNRFKEEPKRQDQFEDDDIIRQIQEKHREEKKRKMLKNSSVFKSNEARFKDSKAEMPGPGSYYDADEDNWNKRTYNILFADI